MTIRLLCIQTFITCTFAFTLLIVHGELQGAKFTQIPGKRSNVTTRVVPVTSVVSCTTTCLEESGCTLVSHSAELQQCEMSDTPTASLASLTEVLEDAPGWDVYYKQDPECREYLESGPNGVYDSQLSASSYWCQFHFVSLVPDCHAAHYGRLGATGWLTGAWIPSTNNTQQWIQVAFNEQKLISGIVLKGRDPVNDINYVTSFKVIVSRDCLTWTTLTDETGSPKVFAGTSGPDVTVTRILSSRVVARCVRVNPITWFCEIALRFDVLGCTL